MPIVAVTLPWSAPPRHGVSAMFRLLLAVGSFMLTLAVSIAVTRVLIGLVPANPYARSPALLIHLATAIPAIPLGAYVLLSKKGGARHKLLGKIWLGLMFLTACSTLWLREVNDGNFSWIHLFTVLTFLGVPKAIITARKGDIKGHRKHLLGFFTGALLVAGVSAFAPGRLLWTWLLG